LSRTTAARAGATTIIVTSILVAYVASYAACRQTHIERWDHDNREYVIFGSRMSYRLFRPLSYLDEAATGVGAHLGPHR
jgi:hypothetical protein